MPLLLGQPIASLETVTAALEMQVDAWPTEWSCANYDLMTLGLATVCTTAVNFLQ